MARIVSYVILFTVVVSIFIACGKDEVTPPADTRFPLPLLTKDATGDNSISGKNPEAFHGKFVVGLHYGTEVMPQKVDVVVVMNDNKTNVKTLKANVTSFPATIDVTGAELSSLFDSTIKLGDKFVIAADVTTKEGQKFLAFPATGHPYGADTATVPGTSFSISYITECTFNIADFNGYYKVLTPTWDFQVGDSVEVRPGTGNSILITAWPNPDVGNFIRVPMRVDVDPVTFVATVPMQAVGEFAGGMTHMIDEGTGTVSPCGDKITLSLMFMVGMYYGAQPLVLGK